MWQVGIQGNEEDMLVRITFFWHNPHNLRKFVTIFKINDLHKINDLVVAIAFIPNTENFYASI